MLDSPFRHTHTIYPTIINSLRFDLTGMIMAPLTPLPLPEQFSQVDAYLESLLSFATSSELFLQLCGGVHILDFYTREPGIYSAVLPLCWRDWFKAIAIEDLLDLLMRENLEMLA